MIAPAALPIGDVSVLYNQVITISNGTTPFTALTVTAFNAGGTGLLGPTVNPGAGTVTVNGTPTVGGTMTFSVNATDSVGGAP